jgi:hypothetical protein
MLPGATDAVACARGAKRATADRRHIPTVRRTRVGM